MTLTKQDLIDALQNVATKDDLKSEINGLRVELSDKIDRRINEVKVLIEDVRHDIKFTLEAREPHEEKLQIHDQKIKEHDHKIQTLEDYVYSKDQLR